MARGLEWRWQLTHFEDDPAFISRLFGSVINCVHSDHRMMVREEMRF